MLLFLTFFAFIILLWKWYTRKDPDEPPIFPGAWPVLGHAPLFFGNTLNFWKVIKTLSEVSMKMGHATHFFIGPVKFYSNCTLTKGRTCFMFVYGVHRHPMWGPDAEEFKPERWIDPATLPKCPTAFAGFGMGRRICIGKSYAYMSMKTTLAHLYRHYIVKGDHTKLKAKLDVMLKPVSGHYITIERRKK